MASDLACVESIAIDTPLGNDRYAIGRMLPLGPTRNLEKSAQVDHTILTNSGSQSSLRTHITISGI